MKKLIFPFVFVVLVSLLTSCTADELPTEQDPPTDISQDGDNIPPIVIKPNPGP